MTNRLPSVGGDDDNWGGILNDYLLAGHNSDGTHMVASTSTPGFVQMAGDLGGSGLSPTITSTHLSTPLPLSQGGTGSAAGLLPGITAWYNVRSYGATGNGSGDDAPAINAAIAAAAAAGGGVVYLPAGTYSTGSSIVINADNIVIKGDGKGSTIVKPVTNATFDAIATGLPPSSGAAGYVRYFVGVEGMTLDCTRMLSTVTGMGNGIHFYGVRYSYIRDVYINGCLNFGICLDGDATNFGYSIEVRGCRIVNGSAGILTNSCEECFIVTNDILQANANTASQQPLFNSQSNLGYLVRLVSGYSLLLGNVLGSSGSYTTAAVQCENAGPTRIEGNRFDQARYQAIRVTAPNTVIVGNQIGNPSSAGSVEGIRVGANNTTIANNIFDLTNGAAHFTYAIAEGGGPFTGNLIYGNQLVAGTSGVLTQNAGSNNIISGNVGYNPVGALASPAVPASGTAYTNKFGVTASVYVAGGTVSAIAIAGTATGATSGLVVVGPGQTITLTYTAAPTWTWFGA